MQLDHMWERTDWVHTLFSLIYSNYTALYMFRTNQFIISRSILCTCSIQYFHGEIML